MLHVREVSSRLERLPFFVLTVEDISDLGKHRGHWGLSLA